MKKKPFWLAIPPWVILGSLAILIPLFALMTVQSINAQRDLTTQLLFEKGDALVRSFEAGARTGLGMQWGSFEIQKLLIDTARQPGVEYLIITDLKGTIIADSDPAMVGEAYGTELESAGEAKSGQAYWRQITRKEQVEPGSPEKTNNTFEVYHYFSLSDSNSPDSIIFLGLDMDPVISARNRDIMHTVVIASILLFLSVAGILFLLLALAYRSARSSLARAEAMSETLIRNMPIGLVALDMAGKFVSLNETAESLLGLKSEDILGRGSAGVLTDALLDAIEAVRAGAGEKSGTFSTEAQCRLGGRENVTLEIMAALLRDENGESLGTVVLFRDLTEMRQLREEIARSQRLASIGNLAAGVAHEIRNPLSSIKGFATYFKERYRDNPEDSGTAQIMIEEVDRLNRVISQLLELSRPSGVRLERRDVCALVRHVLVLAREQAGVRGISIAAGLPDAPVFAYLDQDKMEQALLNVLLNAIQASRDNGSICVAVASDGGRVRIEVADEGRGISEKDLPRIFDPYFTTSPSGTGLGLAIVSKIVEAHRGEIRVDSREGHGTKIEILIPEKAPEKTEGTV
jgi:two-component system sensor histidine kinase HydH